MPERAEGGPPLRIALAGANSSVGRCLLRHVAADSGVTAVACVRSPAAAAELPTSERIRPAVVAYDDADGLTQALAGADAVVHLAGVLFEGPGRSYRVANVETTAAVVEAASKAGVRHLVFVSALGADARSSNAYLRSKGEAEDVVVASGLASTLIRTPLLLGPDSAGGQALLALASRPLTILLGGGRHVLRPLDLDDLASAVINACRHPPEGVETHELVGPEALAHRELVGRMAVLTGREMRILPVPVAAVRAVAAVLYRLRGHGLSPAVVDVITADEVVTTNADAALGVTLTPLTTTLEKLTRSHDRT